MSSFQQKMTMEELLICAKNVNYIEPNKDVKEWSIDELHLKSINVALDSYAQLQSLINICNTFPPLKIFVKSQLRNYIKQFE
jgi:hypothetical protein